MITSGINFYLLFIFLFTMIMSDINALYECNLKKIIALSTLSRLGLIIIFIVEHEILRFTMFTYPDYLRTLFFVRAASV